MECPDRHRLAPPASTRKNALHCRAFSVVDVGGTTRSPLRRRSGQLALASPQCIIRG